MDDKELQRRLFAKPVPNEKYRKGLDFIKPYFNKAIKRAEGNPNNYGVLSEKVSSPSEANKILNTSIENNFWRWIQAGQPMPFVDFMQKRWAPIGATNDPNNLNINWAPNVRKSLQQQLGDEEYKRWKRLNLVYNNPPWYTQKNNT